MRYSPSEPSEDAHGPALDLPFRLRGYDGHVLVYYTANQDPAHWGFDLPGLAATPFDLAQAEGYPVCEAHIAYDGSGYRSLMGWIQLIAQRNPASGSEEEVSVDLPPVHADLNTPFAQFGYAPTMFDAPANPDHETEDWIAQTFLSVCPDVVRTRQVAALLGFRWGYQLRARRAQPLPIKPIGPEAWNQVVPILHTRFDGWTFLTGFAAL